MKLGEMAARLECKLCGPSDTEVTSAAPIESAGPGQITFLANRKYKSFLETTGASAVVLSPEQSCERLPSLRSDDPYLLFARVVDLLYPDKSFAAGHAASAMIAKNAEVDPSCYIGEFSVIGKKSVIGADTIVDEQVFIGSHVSIGAGCRFYPGVKILDDTIIGERVIIHAGAVIGSDGFGYASSAAGHRKFKQVGNVVIGDNVEIGANCTIDRAALGSTVVGSGTKLDNLVHLAHGVNVGEHCLMAAQCGISGSTKIGNWVAFGGQVGAIGHINIEDHASAAAQAGIVRDIPAGTTVFGMPARDIRLARRIEAVINKLPDINRRLITIEKSNKNSDKKKTGES